MRILILAILVFSTGVSAMEPPRPPDWVVTGTTPAPPPPAPGSLWNEARARGLIGMDGTTRQVGDLITVSIAEASFGELEADTRTSRSSQTGGRIGSLFGLKKRMNKSGSDMAGSMGFGAESASQFAGDGRTRRDGAFEATLTCKVMSVLPNGNLVIWGTKQIDVNKEGQFIVLTGEVRPRDIQADNTVMSHLIANMQLVTDGTGVVTDRARGPGFMARVMDNIWPF